MPTRCEITAVSKSRSISSVSYFSAVPHELDTSPVRTPASWNRATASIIASSGPMSAHRSSISVSARSSPSPSAPASPRENSRSSSRPSSSSNSSERALSSSRNASRTCSGSSPSRSQKPANAAKTFVVSTPPKSTSRPLRPSGAKRELLGALGDLDHAVAERLEERVVGAPGHRALVVALHEHDRLPRRQRQVPAQVADRAPAALRVALDHRGARREALLPRHRAQPRQPALRIARLRPRHAQVAEVGERVADRRHLPVEDRVEPWRDLERVHHVAQPEVAVDHGGRPGLGEVVGQPATHRLDLGDLTRLVVFPQAVEAPQLALEIAAGLAEALQPARLPVDGMDL